MSILELRSLSPVLGRHSGRSAVAFDNKGGSVTPEAWWKALEKSGWLDEVPKTEAARIKKAYRDCAKQGVPFRALAPDGFDAECIENPGDYKRWVVKAY